MTEHDPHGLDPHAPGAKLDAGKPRPALVLDEFANALSSVVAVGTYGARKYSPRGWVHVDNAIERYKDAAQRHWLRRACGEECDPDTELLHLAHEAWNILAVLELTLRQKDNTPDG